MIFSFTPSMYMEMCKLAMQTTKMMMSSSEVIAYRLTMMNKVFLGSVAWTDPEFTKLWQEKVAASMESYTSMTKSMMQQSFSPSRSMDDNMTNSIKAIAAYTRPYSSKANANAVRLRKKKI